MMLKRFIIIAFLLLNLFVVGAQTTVELKGNIIDQTTKEPISDVNVVFSDNVGLTSKRDGSFYREIKKGAVSFSITHTKYVPQTFYLTLKSDSFIVIELIEEVNDINEVVISADKNDFVKNLIPGMVSIKQSDIVSQPAILGIPDVVSVLQRGTGVQSVSEGVSGIYVRGGGAGQNLILYDNIELVDPSHLMGTYSVFNPYQIESVDLYKGNSPVQYAGRLSSSIVVNSFDDVSDQPHVIANIGTLASSLSLAHQKGNVGVMLGVRRTQLEAYKEVVSYAAPETAGFLRTNNYSFYDHNGKLFYNNKKKDQIALSWYLGADDLKYNANAMEVGIAWQNRGAALTWKHTDNNYSTQTVLGYTNYVFDFDGDVMGYTANFDSQYNTIYLKQLLTRIYDNHLLTVNFDCHYYDLVPQRSSLVNSVSTYGDADRYRSVEGSFSLADRWQMTDKLSLYYGVRANHFVQLGPATYYEMDGLDTVATHYSKGEQVQSYFTLSPQLFLTWERPNNRSYKVAYSYNAQNVHRGSLATLPLPADLWITSTKLIKPEYAHLASLGVYKSYGIYDFSAEVYGKLMNNILLFEANITGELKANFEENFKAGDGYSAGLELLARKNTGRLNGWVAYTLSKSKKHIDDINDNSWFDAKYDRVHDLSIVLNYKLSKRWDLSSSFVLASGNKATVPAGRYYMMGYVMNDYTDINGFRMPTYHRLDLGVNYNLKPKWFQESVINISIINVYNRKNTYFFFYEMRGSIEDQNITVKPSQFSLFPVLPSVSWTFKF